MHTSSVLRAALGAALGLGPWLTQAALAADEPTVMDRVNRELDAARKDQAPTADGDRLTFDWGGEAAFSYVHSDQPAKFDYTAVRTDLKVHAYLADGDRQMLFVRVRALHDDGLGRNVFLNRNDQPADTRDLVYVDRCWYRVDLAKALGADGAAWNGQAQIGLQQIRWGSGLVLDNALYAAQAEAGTKLGDAGSLQATGLVGWTPVRDFYDFDLSRPGRQRDQDRLFYGGQLAWQDARPARTKVYTYVLGQRDHNDTGPATPLGTPASLAPLPASFGYDSQYWGLGASGAVPGLSQLSYQAEGVLERGRGMSTPMNTLGAPVAQTREDVDAWAAQALLAWTFRDERATRIEAEALAGSGDSDRFGSSSSTLGGNAAGTRDHSFNAFGYARTGLLYNAPVSNLLSVRLGASTFLIPRELKVGVDAYLLRKLDSAGASHETTKAGSDLGSEFDFHADWRALSDVTFSAHYGIFFPGSAASNGREARHFVFTGVRYAF